MWFCLKSTALIKLSQVLQKAQWGSRRFPMGRGCVWGEDRGERMVGGEGLPGLCTVSHSVLFRRACVLQPWGVSCDAPWWGRRWEAPVQTVGTVSQLSVQSVYGAQTHPTAFHTQSKKKNKHTPMLFYGEDQRKVRTFVGHMDFGWSSQL